MIAKNYKLKHTHSASSRALATARVPQPQPKSATTLPVMSSKLFSAWLVYQSTMSMIKLSMYHTIRSRISSYDCHLHQISTKHTKEVFVSLRLLHALLPRQQPVSHGQRVNYRSKQTERRNWNIPKLVLRWKSSKFPSMTIASQS